MSKPVGNALTPADTPLHVADLVLLLIKDTFQNQDPAKWPFMYTGDPETSNIAFDTVYNKESQVYGEKPVIIISRGGQTTSPVVVSDRGATSFQTMNTVGTAVVRSSVDIKVISRKPREVDIVSQHVFNILTMFRVIFPGMLGILAIDNIGMSPVSQMEQEDHMYFSVLSMSYQMQYLWNDRYDGIVLTSITSFVNSVKNMQIS